LEIEGVVAKPREGIETERGGGGGRGGNQVGCYDMKHTRKDRFQVNLREGKETQRKKKHKTKSNRGGKKRGGSGKKEKKHASALVN